MVLLVVVAILVVVRPGAQSTVADPQLTPGYDREFPIGAWYTFVNDSVPTEQEIAWVREAGINVGHQLINDTPKMSVVLDKVAPHGLSMCLGGDAVVSLRMLPGLVKSLRGHRGLWGYYLKDEPNVAAFAKIRQQADIIEPLDSAAGRFVNLWAAWNARDLGADSFEDYIDRYVEECNPQFLSVDVYPVIKEGDRHRLMVRYYATYELLARKAREFRLPFYAVGLTTALADRQWPDETNMRFEAFTALAYGAQAFIWWSYSPLNSGGREQFFEFPLMPGGKRTKIWYALKKVNAEIQTMKDVFLGADVKGVWHTGNDIPTGTQRLKSLPYPFTRLMSDDEGVLVSFIENEGRSYLVIVNHNVFASQKITLETKRAVRRLMPDGKTRDYKGNTITLGKGAYAIFDFTSAANP